MGTPLQGRFCQVDIAKIRKNDEDSHPPAVIFRQIALPFVPDWRAIEAKTRCNEALNGLHLMPRCTATDGLLTRQMTTTGVKRFTVSNLQKAPQNCVFAATAELSANTRFCGAINLRVASHFGSPRKMLFTSPSQARCASEASATCHSLALLSCCPRPA